MKKLFFMAVAAIAALSSCTSDNDLELNKNTGKEALTFTATMEDSEATRATYDSENKYALWEVGDQISINGKTYSAQEAGATSTFKADGEGATGTTYNAYFPADLYDGTTATLPAIQTYTAGKFNMPMYATSTTTELAFKNLCAVLAIKVTSADIPTLKSIKVASDKKMNGKFTVSDNAAVMGTDGTNAVVLESSEALTLTSEGTTFYIAIPAQEYKFLNIFLSADGETYTQAMATKKAAGLGAIARSKIFNIDYAKNATKLWAGNLFFADCNIGATSPEAYGGYYNWGMSEEHTAENSSIYNEGTVTLTGEDDTATKLWGANWRMMTKEELEKLKGFGSWNSNGLLCESPDYENNTIFLPAAYSGHGRYWSSTPNAEKDAYHLLFTSAYQGVSAEMRYSGFSVRAVLEEAASPAPAAEYPEGSVGTATRTGEIDVNWVQLWKDGPKFAEYNVGVTDGNAESSGGYYRWGIPHDLRGGWPEEEYETADIANTLWGSSWRMPTNEELKALFNEENCTCTWTTQNEVNGWLFTGKNAYAANSIFLPAVGAIYDGEVEGDQDCGYYWSSTMANDEQAYLLSFDLNGYDSSYEKSSIYYGYPVRAVLVPESSSGTATRKGDISVNWVQLWENGPKFAEYNVGATSATGVGGYYEWANNIVSTEWGSDWRMPTKAELEALLDKCDVAWTGDYNGSGIAGRIFTGKDTYSTNSIFLPAAGYYYNNELDLDGSAGSYWSSTQDSENNGNSYDLYFQRNDWLTLDSDPYEISMSVRAVLAE